MHDGLPAMPTRRGFLRGAGALAGSLAFQTLAAARQGAGLAAEQAAEHGGLHFAPRAKRVVFLFQAGAPSQIDLLDPKPRLRELDGQEMPQSLVAGEAVDQLQGRTLRIAGSCFDFRRHGESGLEVSELLPHTARIADDIAVVRSMHTDVITHSAAQVMMQTGHFQAGRPCVGSWTTYGLGTTNPTLPGFVVLVSGGTPTFDAGLWSNGFLPGVHQGVRLRNGPEPVPFLTNPLGVGRRERRAQLDALRTLNEHALRHSGDPEIETRIAAYEMAYRMQRSVPDLVDFSDESPSTLERYGVREGEASYAANCLLARRLLERDVRFVQLYHDGWDHHYNLPRKLRKKCAEVDQGSAALVQDLKERGLLEDTLVVWGGEFGRTPMQQGGRGGEHQGRDHHGKAFTIWMAGGGIKPGTVYGATDELGYDIIENPVHVHDLHATMLHLLGIDHKRLTFRHQGRDYRLTDVDGRVIRGLLA